MSRLWEKGLPLDDAIHRFTVGDDPQLDRALVYWDCLGSAAHALTLLRAGLLSESECDALRAALGRIATRAAAGDFEIPVELEDCHTAIEAALVAELGETGKKIHAGRSRNDQVATAMRLWLRSRVFVWLDLLDAFAIALDQRLAEIGDIPMPGLTHMQPAMPSSLGQWLHAQLEAVLEQMRAAHDLLNRLDSCPLGTGAGFGVALGFDREYTAQLLGFARAQRSPIDVQNSRGRLERYFVRVAADMAALIEKFACDLLLFFSPPWEWIKLPAAFTTGSSIMPQKRNPDVLELLRARAARLRAAEVELAWVTGKLPSSYHRDLQLTKNAPLAAASEVETLLDIATRVVQAFTPDAARLRAALTPELYATDAAFARVRAGAPFRDAYRSVAEEIRAGTFTADPQAPEYAALGRADATMVAASRSECLTLKRRSDDLRAEIERQLDRLLG